MDGESVQEIQGHNNKRPLKYWQQVLDFFDSKPEINYKDSPHYNELNHIFKLNQGIQSGDPHYLSFAKEVIDDYDEDIGDMANKFTDETLQSNPEIEVAMLARFKRELSEYPGQIKSLP